MNAAPAVANYGLNGVLRCAVRGHLLSAFASLRR